MGKVYDFVVGHKSIKDVVFVRIAIVTGVLCLVAFALVFFRPENRGYSWLYALLCLSVSFKILRVLHEWYHYWKVVPPTPPPVTRTWTVDILTTFCPGEPYEMIVNTLQAIQAIQYPHTTYLCDEANDPYLRQVCAELGVTHVTRIEKKDAKAGNINNALRQATGEICVVLDPDHVPVSDFLDHVLPYFEDAKIGFVQCVQAYYNRKESLVAYGAAEQTYSFYGPLMTCMGNYGTAQAIGANCTFRREALDSIGGHAAGLSEDMHTAMQLHAKGWKSVYVPKPLSYGLVPATLAAYYKQQLKWARGTFELLLVTYPQLFGRLSWRQRIHYFTVPLYYLIGLIQAVDLLIPVFSLLLLRLPLRLDLEKFALAYLPVLFMVFLIRQYAQRWLIEKHEVGFHLVGGILTSGTWWIYVLGLMYSILRIDVPYLPTPKNDTPRNNFLLCLPNALVVAATLGAITYSVYYYGLLSVGNWYVVLMALFGMTNIIIMGMNVMIGQEKLLTAIRERFRTNASRRSGRGSTWLAVWRHRYSVYGWLRASAIPLYGLSLLAAMVMVGYTFQQALVVVLGDVRYATTQAFYYDDTVPKAERLRNSQSVIIPQHLLWPVDQNVPIAQPEFTSDAHKIPLVYLEPAFQSEQKEEAIQGYLKKLLAGKENRKLTSFFKHIKSYNRPVLVAFAPFFDDTTKTWGVQKGTLLLDYRRAFRYITRFAELKEVNNIIWAWCPAEAHSIAFYYPGNEVVDWIGLKIINDPAKSQDGESHSFSALYQPLRNAIMRHHDYEIQRKPVLITTLYSPLQGDWKTWRTVALEHIHERYPEIRGAILKNR